MEIIGLGWGIVLRFRSSEVWGEMFTNRWEIFRKSENTYQTTQTLRYFPGNFNCSKAAKKKACVYSPLWVR